MRRVKTAILLLAACFLPTVTNAQAPQTGAGADMSPTLLIETTPSDNPTYRRMVIVRYLSANGVTAAYKAYNRSEFIRVEDNTPANQLSECLQGRATTLRDVQHYQQTEAQALQTGAAPIPARFCIRGVDAWERGNKSVWLDPIFEGMPHAARFKKIG